MRIKLGFVLVLVWTFLFFIPPKAFAADGQYITLVNPVRISSYTKSPAESVLSQYEVVEENRLPATWLLTYDVLKDESVLEVLKNMNEDQELGVFLEVRPALTENSGVDYNETYFWHHATSVFLSGYEQEERKRMIDTLFETFRSEFGYYPSSVGSWWTDSYSLDYMSKKYGVTANLTVADQFSTDGYQIWGQYWAAPYYPSKYHSAVPASSEEVKLDVVNLQWAPRDPLHGYKSSLYSTQDYSISEIGLTIDYFEKLIELYGKKNSNLFGQITVGLEGDLEPEVYKREYKKQLELLRDLDDKEEFEVTTMKQFSDWYRSEFEGLSPEYLVESGDLLEESDFKVIWYQSPKYRIGLLFDSASNTTEVFDFRTYHPDLQEPYYLMPNKEFQLSIYVPSYIDKVINEEDGWNLGLGPLIETDVIEAGYELEFEDGRIKFTPESIEIVSNDDLSTPLVIKESSALDVEDSIETLLISTNRDWIAPREGVFVHDLTEEATHLLYSKRTIAKIAGVILAFIFLSIVTIRSPLSDTKKLLILTLMIIPLFIFVIDWYKGNTQKYYVSQGEIDTLFRLSVLPEGKVLVYDNECLGCTYHTEVKPAVFANKRNYVTTHGKHPIVYNSSVFEAKNQKEAKEEFDKLNTKYIYIVRYEEYIEKVPFSPGDLGIKKVYGNANSELWVKKD